jgi:hypothetical protein
MFAQTWRNHWGLGEDAFAHEDADKDPVLSRVDAAAVHSAFDRIFGSPDSPAPSVVFGEKGSGKSGLRLALQRGLVEHNKQHPERRVFSIEYTEFDSFLDLVPQNLTLRGGSMSAGKTVARFTQADHIDAILCNGVSSLTDTLLAAKKKTKGLSRKQKIDLLALAALYYRTDKRSRKEAAVQLRQHVRFRSSRPAWATLLKVLLTVAGFGLIAAPHLPVSELQEFVANFSDRLFYAVGGSLLAITWLVSWFTGAQLKHRASRALRSVRSMPRETEPLRMLLASIKPDQRRDFPFPHDTETASRFHLLTRFQALLAALGYENTYAFIDRVDESTMLGGREDWTRVFIESVLDHKLLQQPNIGFKIFLPIELSQIHTGASVDALKRMRLDKANIVEELRWTGQELYQIATERLRAAVVEGQHAQRIELSDLMHDDVTPIVLREALNELGTPRHAFRFLSNLFSDYARNLPDEIEADSDEWRVPRGHFDIVRASWSDKARTMRRVMN